MIPWLINYSSLNSADAVRETRGDKTEEIRQMNDKNVQAYLFKTEKNQLICN